MLTTSDQRFAEIVQSNRNHGAEPKYYHSRVGGNFRLDPIQAAVLTVKLAHLDTWHAARRRNAGRYRQLFHEAGLAGEVVTLPQEVYADRQGADRHNHHVYNQFVILAPERDKLRLYLQEHAVGSEIYYPLCLHQQECLRQDEYRRQSFPVAQQAAASSLALPIFPELADEQLVYVVETIRRFYRGG
jgi:dTDP-4-amino-4,6-dideoxygalactose transaminase